MLLVFEARHEVIRQMLVTAGYSVHTVGRIQRGAEYWNLIGWAIGHGHRQDFRMDDTSIGVWGWIARYLDAVGV